MSLYDELGGESAIRTAVDDFYGRVMAHPVLSPWFVSIDSHAFRSHLCSYFAVTFGGPEAYSGRSMRNVHGGLGVTTAAFDSIVELLSAAFIETGADRVTVQKLDSRLQSLRAVLVHPV